MPVQIGSVDPDGRVTEHAFKFNEYASVFPIFRRKKVFSVPADAVHRLHVRMLFGRISVKFRAGARAGKGVCAQILFKPDRPVVGQINLLPVAVFIKSARRAGRVHIFFKTEMIEVVNIVFKSEKPILIYADFVHESNAPFSGFYVYYTEKNAVCNIKSAGGQ